MAEDDDLLDISIPPKDMRLQVFGESLYKTESIKGDENCLKFTSKPTVVKKPTRMPVNKEVTDFEEDIEKLVVASEETRGKRKKRGSVRLDTRKEAEQGSMLLEKCIEQIEATNAWMDELHEKLQRISALVKPVESVMVYNENQKFIEHDAILSIENVVDYNFKYLNKAEYDDFIVLVLNKDAFNLAMKDGPISKLDLHLPSGEIYVGYVLGKPFDIPDTTGNKQLLIFLKTQGQSEEKA